MMNKKGIKSFNMSRFFCTECGNEGVPCFRNGGQQRKSGHLKKLYCTHCKAEKNFVEIKDKGEYRYEDFLEEFRCGRFVNGNRIPIKDLPSCKKECPYNKDGKCWNTSGSVKCEERKSI